MKIKIGKVQKDLTAFGNKYWIQIEDNSVNDNSDVESLVGKSVSIVIGDISAVDNLIQQVEVP